MNKYILLLVATFFVNYFGTAQDSASVITPQKSIQERLNAGETPKQLFVAGIKVDDLYGKEYAGGIIFYYDTATHKGMAMSKKELHYLYKDTAVHVQWSCLNTPTGATETKIGSGKRNTQKIVDAQCSLYEPDVKKWILPAAEICTHYRGGGFHDWYLPSKDELCQIYFNLAETKKHDFNEHMYWSSSEKNKDFAWIQYFINGGQGYYVKHFNYFLLAVRDF